LNRFSLAHLLLPPLLAALSWLHLALLHLRGSSTPLAIPSIADRTGLLPAFYLKDLVGVVALTWLIPSPTSLHPLLLRQPDTSQMATPMSTPEQIQPEWYFLSPYAILRAIPSKSVAIQ
jgi:ubiquinol-cytochrome c reductase cytochrome b subunit